MEGPQNYCTAARRLLLTRDGSEALFKLHQALQGLEELAKSGSWEHDGVTPTAHVFGNLQKTTPLVLLEVEEEHFPLVSHLFRSYRL